MKSCILLTWLGLVAALPQPTGSGGLVLSATINASATGLASSSTISQQTPSLTPLPTARIREAGHQSETSPSTHTTTKTITQSNNPKTSEIFSRTFEVTATRTVFVPISSSVFEAGSKTFYSTWLTVTYPTTIITSTEYATSTIEPVPQTSKTTVAPSTTPLVTYGCVCPLAITETVYVMASQGPAITVTSAILHTYTSTLPDGQTMTTVVPFQSATTPELTSQVESITTLTPSIPQTSAATTPQTIGSAIPIPTQNRPEQPQSPAAR